MKNNKNLSQELFEKYSLSFDLKSDKEVVESFNSQVGNPGSGVAKSSYLSAIKSQFIKREIDFSEISGYTKKVILKGKKLYID
ncbi:hypothetical protein [Winogradskyella rapida]|uniref:Uncharacterized protein n=1 Tax=Winogradskyella rapida TaxID=549701 RepID=A0ABW3KTB3_9FLAO